ncbi:MAG: flagellar biosynthesis protein FlhB [Alphaproteobacteria bacterium]|nr:flagellar biosynthesis protein FlhB [Alphaproteobacteria bacterium SS10]
MSDEQDPETKTEEPTEKRLRDSRRKGEVARSQEVNHFMILLGGALFLLTFAPFSINSIYELIGSVFQQAHTLTIDDASVGDILSELVTDVLIALSLPLAMFVIFALISGPMQFGLLFTVEPMAPKLSKISLIKGVKRMFSLSQFVELLKGIVKIAVIGLVAVIIMWPVMETFSAYTGITIGEALAAVYIFALKVAGGALFVMAIIALIDTLYQRYEFTKKMRMTKNEVKDEMKQAEGDPQIKARLRKLRVERSRQRMMTAVPQADVVITNPTHYAIALAYDGTDMEAPQVVAKGQDAVALRIRDLAFEHEVPVVENPTLARTLHAAYEIDDLIQPEHYQAVAEIISYVFQLKRKTVGGQAVAAGAGGPARPPEGSELVDRATATVG